MQKPILCKGRVGIFAPWVRVNKMLVASRTGEAATRGQDRGCLEFGVGVGVLISSVTRFPQEKEM